MKTAELYLYYQNVRSLVSKISILSPVLTTSCFDVIAFSETWLSSYIFNSEMNFTNYTIYRCDRSSYNNSSSRDGGVLIAINSTLKSKVLNVSVNCIEHVFVQLNLSVNIFIFACVYFPLLSPIILYEQFFLAIDEIYLSNPKVKLILLEDFNLPSSRWSLYSLSLMCNSQIDSYFVSMLSHFDFNRFNLVRNYNNLILDLALSNVHLSVTKNAASLLSIDTPSY